MIKHALFVRLEAKAGKEKDGAQFLQAGLGLARQETATPVWFALQLSPRHLRRLRCLRGRGRQGGSPQRADRTGVGGERAPAAGAGAIDRTHRRPRHQAAGVIRLQSISAK